MKKHDKVVTVVSPNDSIDFAIRKMSLESQLVQSPGLSVVLDDDYVLKGIITDGDLRRAYASDIDFSNPVSEIMVKTPVTIKNTLPDSEITSEILRLVELDDRLNADFIRHIIIVDKDNHFVNVLDFFKVLDSIGGSASKVAIYGMGYVGVTLAVSLSNIGYQVIGIDTNPEIVKLLQSGSSHVHEPSLEELLRKNLSNDKIKFTTKINDKSCNVYIIAVGTPLNKSGKPGLGALKKVLESISFSLKPGDQVVLRSTVPVGTSREVVIPFLEKKSGLKAGENFCVTFSPERTVEGNAIYELKNLPQIVGGYTASCTKRGIDFWSNLTHHVVKMPSLESAELVKLANNTFRDISFAFANELALLADKYNVNAFDLIQCANEGYKRNKIPMPSPGVGGYCLTKDPILFSSNLNGLRRDAVLGVAGRSINEAAAIYPYTLIERYASNNNLNISDLTILIIGVAFKGDPETNDTRGAVALELLRKINSDVKQVLAWDAVLTNSTLNSLGFDTQKNIEESISNSDVVLILNNHPKNAHPYFYSSKKGKKLIFDGWNQLDRLAIERLANNTYSTMGYMSKD